MIAILSPTIFRKGVRNPSRVLYFNEEFGVKVGGIGFGNLTDTTAVTPYLPLFVGPILPTPKWIEFNGAYANVKGSQYCGGGFNQFQATPTGVAFNNKFNATQSYAFPTVPIKIDTNFDYSVTMITYILQAFSTVGFASQINIEADVVGGLFFVFQIVLHADAFYLEVYSKSSLLLSSTQVGNGTTTGPFFFNNPHYFTVKVHNRIATVFIDGIQIVTGISLGAKVANAYAMGYGFADTFSDPNALQACLCSRFFYTGISQ